MPVTTIVIAREMKVLPSLELSRSASRKGLVCSRIQGSRRLPSVLRSSSKTRVCSLFVSKIPRVVELRPTLFDILANAVECQPWVQVHMSRARCEEQLNLRPVQQMDERVQVERPQSKPFRQRMSATADISLCIIAFEPEIYSDTCASGVKGVELRREEKISGSRYVNGTVWAIRSVLHLPRVRDLLCQQHLGDGLSQQRSWSRSALYEDVCTFRWMYKARIRRQRLAIDSNLIHLRVECLLV